MFCEGRNVKVLRGLLRYFELFYIFIDFLFGDFIVLIRNVYFFYVEMNVMNKIKYLV